MTYKLVHGNTGHVFGDNDGTAYEVSMSPISMTQVFRRSFVDGGTDPEMEKILPA